jgi:hypothetical protein
MHEDRSTAGREDREPPRMGPALATYAHAYFCGGAPHNSVLSELLYARIRTFGAETVAAQAREACARLAEREGA